MRDIKSKKHNPVQDPNEIEQVEKNILMYETALKTFHPDSEEWYMCQFNLEKEKADMNCCLLSQEVRKILENIENLQAQDFMEKQLYEELFR